MGAAGQPDDSQQPPSLLLLPRTASPGSGLRHLLEGVCGLWVNMICQSPCKQDVSPPENKTPASPSGQLTESRLARATYWPERPQTRAVLLRTNQQTIRCQSHVQTRLFQSTDRLGNRKDTRSRPWTAVVRLVSKPAALCRAGLVLRATGLN